MSTDIKLSSPKLRVIMGNPDDPNTWAEHEFQTIGRDTTAAETLFGVSKWGRTIDHPVRFLAALGYYAMLRTGKFIGSFDDFEQSYIELVPIGNDVAYPIEAAVAPA